MCEAYIEAKRGEVASHGSLQSALRPIIEAFGPLNPADIQQTNLTTYVTERLKAPKRRGARGGVVVEVAGTLSRKTIKNELLMFKTACTWAKDEGWPVTIPPIKKQKRATKQRKRILSRREFGAIMLALEAPETALHLRTFVYIALLTGQRRSAILALRWQDIDIEEGMVWFTRARPDAPENKRVQDHPMSEDMREVLRRALLGAKDAREKAAKRGNEVHPIEYVIEHKQQPVASVKTAWHALLARAGAPEDIWVHDLRRTTASYARNSGRSNAEVAIYINDSEEITERVYAHADPSLLLPMQETIAEIMAKEREAAAKRDGGPNADALHSEGAGRRAKSPSVAIEEP